MRSGATGPPAPGPPPGPRSPPAPVRDRPPAPRRSPPRADSWWASYRNPTPGSGVEGFRDGVRDPARAILAAVLVVEPDRDVHARRVLDRIQAGGLVVRAPPPRARDG